MSLLTESCFKGIPRLACHKRIGFHVVNIDGRARNPFFPILGVNDGDIFHCVTRWFPFYGTSQYNPWVFTHGIVRIPVSAITAIGLLYIHIAIAGKDFFIWGKIRVKAPIALFRCVLAGTFVIVG